MLNTKVALITGSAKRVGACIAHTLHDHGMRIIIHYNQSKEQAQKLCNHFNQKRSQSAIIIQADLQDPSNIAPLIAQASTTWGRLDVLINNAASFYDTPLNQLTLTSWNSILHNNLTAPVFLSTEASVHLQKTKGCIINMVDIRAHQPLKRYTAYCISKAGLVMATKSLALEWAPDIRVNAIAPGVVLWPDEVSETEAKIQKKIIARTPLKRVGTAQEVAQTVLFLIQQATYMTGQVLTLDGGRSLAY